MHSTVVTIREEDEISLSPQKKLPPCAPVTLVSSLLAKQSKPEVRRAIHSVKVGVALVVISLLYLLDPLYNQVGENAMWAIMTVVVVFEFFAGATLGKGVNRAIGTILGGGLGCIVALLGDALVGGVGNAIFAATFVFVFGIAATYVRLIPRIKRRYDYGAMIFILTFNLIVVSGWRADEVIRLARERLVDIGIGLAVSVFTSVLAFPMWASDELHFSIASKFDKLASCVEGCLEEYFISVEEKENRCKANSSGCESVLNSKSNDETLANFARWEPWHGKFGIFYPWDKYLRIGDVLRELAATLASLKGCLQSPRQPMQSQRQLMKQPLEEVGSSLAWTLGELGQRFMKMEKSQPKALIPSKLQAIKEELTLVTSASKLEGSEGLAMSTFVFLLMEIVDKVEILAKEVEELGEIAGFRTK